MIQGWLHQSERNITEAQTKQFVGYHVRTIYSAIISNNVPLTSFDQACVQIFQNDAKWCVPAFRRQLTFPIQATNKCRDTTQTFRTCDSTFRRGASSTGPSQPVQLSPCWNRKFSAWSIFTLSFPQLSLVRKRDTKEHKHEWCCRETILGVVHVSPRPGLEWMRWGIKHASEKIDEIKFQLVFPPGEVLPVVKAIVRDGCPCKPTPLNCYQLGCSQ